MTNDPVAIKLGNVSKTFHIYDKASYTIRERFAHLFNPNKSRRIEALRNINLTVNKGEILGIIGRNGSGKSTLLKVMAGIYPADKGGKVILNGDYVRLTLGVGFNPEFTARQNIYLNGSLLGLTFRMIGNIFAQIIDFSELHDFVDTKLKYYSSGMVARLAFSIAIHVDSDIIFLDEFIGGVGDEKFMEKSQEIFQSSFVGRKTILLVSHDLQQIRKYCHRAVFMERGECIKIGDPEEIIDLYVSSVS